MTLGLLVFILFLFLLLRFCHLEWSSSQSIPFFTPLQTDRQIIKKEGEKE